MMAVVVAWLQGRGGEDGVALADCFVVVGREGVRCWARVFVRGQA